MSALDNFMLAATEASSVSSGVFSAEALTSAGVAFASTLVYSLVGLAMFALAYKVLGVMMPFSIRKELEEDQNTALGIVLGSMMLGLAIIIAAAISG